MRLREIVGRRRGRTIRRRDVAERLAEELLEVGAFARGDFIERIVVIHAEKITRLDAVFFQRAENRVVDQHATQRADMHAAGRSLRVIDDLRAVALGSDIFGPKHRARRDSGDRPQVERRG